MDGIKGGLLTSDRHQRWPHRHFGEEGGDQHISRSLECMRHFYTKKLATKLVAGKEFMTCSELNNWSPCGHLWLMPICLSSDLLSPNEFSSKDE